MKIVFLALLVSTNILAAKSFNVKPHAQKILNRIDLTCGDTWCEGQYNFRFNKFTCYNTLPASCTLSFDLLDRGYVKPNGDDFFDRSMLSSAIVYDIKPASCRFNGINSMSDLGTYTESGRFELNEKFYENITSCINDIESHLSK